MKETLVPLDIFSLEGDGFHPKMEVRINGQIVKVILDTGASKTAFDTTVLTGILGENNFQEVEKLSTGLGTNSMQCFKATIDEFSIGNLTLTDYEVAVLDLSHINMAYENLGYESVLGVIGSDLLVELNAIIDYGKRTLLLKQPK